MPRQYHSHKNFTKCAKNNYTQMFKDHLYAKKIPPHLQGTLKKIHFKIINCLPFSSIKWLPNVRYSSLSWSLITWQHHHLRKYPQMPCSPKSNLHATCSLVLRMTSATAAVERESAIKKHRRSLGSYQIDSTEKAKDKYISSWKRCHHPVFCHKRYRFLKNHIDHLMKSDLNFNSLL